MLEEGKKMLQEWSNTRTETLQKPQPRSYSKVTGYKSEQRGLILIMKLFL